MKSSIQFNILLIARVSIGTDRTGAPAQSLDGDDDDDEESIFYSQTQYGTKSSMDD